MTTVVIGTLHFFSVVFFSSCFDLQIHQGPNVRGTGEGAAGDHPPPRRRDHARHVLPQLGGQPHHLLLHVRPVQGSGN